MSNAFLSRAASMAVVTDLGKRLRRAGDFTAALGVADLVFLDRNAARTRILDSFVLRIAVAARAARPTILELAKGSADGTSKDGALGELDYASCLPLPYSP
jgi:hypothetical protein